MLHSRTETLLHEFSFGASADGRLEQGHLNLAALRAPSAPAVSGEVAAVAQPSFAACAAASAVRRYQETEQGTIDDASARIIDLPVPGPHVIWRATVSNHAANGPSHPMYMDVVYLGGGDVLVKVRVASCGCTPPVSTDAELLPGEISALRAIALRLGPPVTTG